MTTEVPKEEPATPDEVEPEDDNATDTDTEGKRALRLRLQQADAEAQALSAQLDVMRRQAIEGRIADALPQQMYGKLTMNDPSDFWSVGGHAPDDLVADDGSVDMDKLTAAVEALRAARPYLFGNETALAEALRRGQPIKHDTAATWQSELQKARASARRPNYREVPR